MNLEKIDLIKIDVEGAELEVLESIKNLIKKHKPFIIIEILPVYSKENKSRLDRLKKIELLIDEFSYHIHLIRKNKKESYSREYS